MPAWNGRTAGVSTPGILELVENDGGGGILAQGSALVECIAEDCAGTGLTGRTLTGCIARGNGGVGMSGDVIQQCTAENNGGTGILTSGNVTGSWARGNADWGVKAAGDKIG